VCVLVVARYDKEVLSRLEHLKEVAQEKGLQRIKAHFDNCRVRDRDSATFGSCPVSTLLSQHPQKIYE
jgi:hypothetical protein